MSHPATTNTTTAQPTLMFLNSASVSLVVVRCVILPWRWEVQMEAVVDMTPRLRIPSSRRKQRSLSPSHPLFFLSPCWNVPLSYFLALPISLFSFLSAPVWCFLFQSKPQPHPHTYLNDLWHVLKCHIFPYIPETKEGHTDASYPTVPPYSQPRVQVEKKHSTTAWRSSVDDAKRARREAQARSASLKPTEPVEFSRFKTNRRPERTESRTSKELVSIVHIWYCKLFVCEINNKYCVNFFLPDGLEKKDGCNF